MVRGKITERMSALITWFNGKESHTRLADEAKRLKRQASERRVALDRLRGSLKHGDPGGGRRATRQALSLHEEGRGEGSEGRWRNGMRRASNTSRLERAQW